MARSTQVAIQTSATPVAQVDLSKTPVFLIARNISSLGNNHGDNIRSLAHRANLSPSTLYRWMNCGIRAYNPTLNTMLKLSAAFKTPFHAFVNTTKAGRAALIAK
jgi:transcriptional regulator with XRE-family HTH domain